MNRTLRVGSRRSLLAMAQTRLVVDALDAALRAAGQAPPRVVVVPVTTQGDVERRPLPELGGVGVFVGALRAALLAGEVDVAVHSAKDLPTAPSVGLTVAAFPRRADPRDALCSAGRHTLGTLPRGARIGTGSPRRAAQLWALREDLHVVPMRGNVDSRLAAVAAGHVDAVVVAQAGLDRLGRSADAAQTLDPETMLPAPGQGALAVECRADDDSVRSLLAEALDDRATRVAVLAERAALARLEAGCSAPMGALATIAAGPNAGEPDMMDLRAVVGATDGGRLVRSRVGGLVSDPVRDPVSLGEAVADRLLDAGAADLVPVQHRDLTKERQRT
jgi:hydroxymethylbilane synthase